VVVEKEITQGEVIESGKKVFTISDLSTVWVLLNIFEKDLAQITRNTTVKIQTESYLGETFGGKVAYIGDVIDPQNRTVPLRVEVPNPGRRLKPGMFATAEVVSSGALAKAIVIPASAIQKIEGKPVAFVRQSDSSFAKKELQLGKEMSGKVEVKSGLTEGEQVVIEGSFTLKSELLKGTLAED
jgi:cobalt-zinc-cadmium efflux system membrane fusion protein